MYRKELFQCDQNCPECEKECDFRMKSNKNEQLSKFDNATDLLNILNPDNGVIVSLKNSIGAFEDTDEKIDFIKKCLNKYIRDLIKQNIKEKNDADFIRAHFKEFIDYLANKILEDPK